jgi:hypothetical protein
MDDPSGGRSTANIWNGGATSSVRQVDVEGKNVRFKPAAEAIASRRRAYRSDDVITLGTAGQSACDQIAHKRMIIYDSDT